MMFHTPPNPKLPAGSRAFTLIELIVAMSITVLIISLINTIFNSTSQAVTKGVQLADIIANQRAMGEQFYEDAATMLAPLPTGTPLSTSTTPGVLAIVNYEINRAGNLVMTESNGSGRETTNEFVRSDQLLFLKSNPSTGVQTRAPISVSGYAGQGDLLADGSMVWYGHGNRTNPDGTPSNDLENTTGMNRNPWQWVLARKELYFTNTGETVPAVNVNGVVWNSAVSGYAGNAAAAGVPEVNYSGLADVSNRALVATSPTANGFFDTNSTTGLGDATLPGTYRTALYNCMFMRPAGRVQINDGPISPYQSWRIAQMHPYFMQGVSDFIVEFAGDYHDDASNGVFPDGTPDLDYGTGGTGYDGLPDDTPVTATQGNVVWYSMNNPPVLSPAAAALFTDPYDATPWTTLGLTPATTSAAVAFTWQHDEPDAWPYMIRIRYRLHDGRGRIASTQDTSVDDNMGRGGGSYYVLPTEEVEPITGRWFEIIMPVKREP